MLNLTSDQFNVGSMKGDIAMMKAWVVIFSFMVLVISGCASNQKNDTSCGGYGGTISDAG